jgi:hypothetical protein
VSRCRPLFFISIFFITKERCQDDPDRAMPPMILIRTPTQILSPAKIYSFSGAYGPPGTAHPHFGIGGSGSTAVLAGSFEARVCVSSLSDGD